MLSGIMASAPVAGEAPYYAVMHGNALYGIFDTEAAAEACKAQGHPDAPFSVKPLYAVPQASTVAGEAQEPVAYAVHNIDTKGQTRVAAVKPWAGNESMLDDDRWGDRWAGNRPLVYGDAAPQASAEALEVARAALMEIADLADVEADQRGVIVNQALTKIAKMTVAPQASAEVQPNAEIVALAREGVRVNKPGTPEYQICAELRRLARALKQPQAEQGDAREA